MTRRTILTAPFLGLLTPRAASRQEPRLPSLPLTRLLFGGDVMMSRFVGKIAREAGDPAHPMRSLASMFAAADIAFVNLESPFSDRGGFVEQGMVFKTEPDMIEALKTAGIDVVSTANNHSRDRSLYGLRFTLDWLSRHGIASAGSGETAELAHAGAVLQRNGTRFGFLAYTYDMSNGNPTEKDDRVATMDEPEEMEADVARLKKKADVVIVSMHAGWEYHPKPNSQQIEFAHRSIDAGATLVIGHHPHVTQPWERYHGGLIFYSLGNLVFDQFQRRETQEGLLAEVVFSGPKLLHARAIPIDIVRTVPQVARQRDPEEA